MHRRPMLLRLFILGALFTGFFAFLMPWDRLPDADAFYHIAIADRIAESGPVTSLPQLDLTTLGTTFADQHFLFHVLQIPFLQMAEPLTASRISAVFFAVLTLVGISLVFYKLRLTPWWLWPVLLAMSMPFTTRMIQGKASPLAVLIWFVATGTVAYATTRESASKKAPIIILAICGVLFALTHGGWIILIASVALLLIGDLIFKLAIQRQGLGASLRDLPWRFLLATITGIIVGLILHPGRKQVLSLLYIQVVQVGIFTPRILRMGNEWASATGTNVVGLIGVFIVIGLLCIIGLTHSRKTPLDLSRTHQILLLSPLAAFLFAASIKSVRFAEYFQPSLALWVGVLAQHVDWKQLRTNMTSRTSTGASRASEMSLDQPEQRERSVTKYVLAGVIGMTLIGFPLMSILTAYSSFKMKDRFLDTQYQSPIRAIAAVASPGDRVYHSMWDEFPILFYHEQDLRYVSGLDPTFLYEANPKLALDYQGLALQASTTRSDAWTLIHDRLRARFVLIDHDRYPRLNRLIATDPRYVKLAKGDGATAYALSRN